MPRWPISDEQARAMYSGGRGDDTAKYFARLWGRVFSLGLFPRRWVTLEVTGRRSGRAMRVPLGMADVDHQWYLVSMLGEQCNWVQNARAADGRVVLHRRRPRRCVLIDVPVAARGPVLQRYVRRVPGGRPHIPVAPEAPLSEFVAVASAYPVFAVHRVTAAGHTPWRVAPRWPLGAAAVVVCGAALMTIARRR